MVMARAFVGGNGGGAGDEGLSGPLDLPLQQGLHQVHAAAEPLPADRSPGVRGSIGRHLCGQRAGLAQAVVAIDAANDASGGGLHRDDGGAEAVTRRNLTLMDLAMNAQEETVLQTEPVLDQGKVGIERGREWAWVPHIRGFKSLPAEWRQRPALSSGAISTLRIMIVGTRCSNIARHTEPARGVHHPFASQRMKTS